MSWFPSNLVVVVIGVVLVQPRPAARPDCDERFFLCHDGSRCVEKTKICNQQLDCPDSSDEVFCGKQNCTDGKFPCHDDYTCVPRKLICDLYHDCDDGSDELVCEKQSSEAITSKITETNKECTDKPCSESCVHLQDLNECVCQAGYVIQDNGKCVVQGPSPTLYVAAYNKILSYNTRSINGSKPRIVVDHLKHVFNIAIHGRYLYWTDKEEKAVYKYDIIDQHPPWKLIDTGLKSPSGITIDSVLNHMYVVDSSQNRIVVCDDHGENCTVVLEHLDEPLDITICYDHRLIIWTEGGKKPGIRKSQPNGDNVDTIIQGSAVRPISVVWDSVSGRIFWGDSGLNTVESVDVAGSNRKVVVSRNIQNPVGLAVFEDMIYWADQDHGSVYSADLDTSRRLLPIVTNVGHVTDIVIDHPVLHNVTYGSQDNPCMDHLCSDMCLPTHTSYVCACPVHKKIINNNQCEDDPDCHEVLVGDGSSVLRYPLCGIGYKDHLKTLIHNDNMRQVAVIGWQGDIVLYRDLRRGVIATMAMNNAESGERILYNGLHRVLDATVDWDAGIIYWTTSQKEVKVQAGSLTGHIITTIVKDGIEMPESITRDSERGLLYIADNGKIPQIVVCYTDGRHCSTLNITVSLVSDLTFDPYSKRLFYLDLKDPSIKAVDTKDLYVETVYKGITGENPSDLVVTMDTVYWIDSRNKTLLSIQKNHHYRLETIVLSRLGWPRGIVVRPMKLRSPSQCKIHIISCEDFCFSTPDGTTCQCQDGYNLDSDKKSCHKSCKEFVCGDGLCINKTFVCDGHPDCYDNSDELGCNPVIRTTIPPVATSLSPKRLEKGLNSCVRRNGGCSQICKNKNGSIVCNCIVGYESLNDGIGCSAKGPQPEFVIATYREGIIKTSDLNHSIDLHIGYDLYKVMSLDVNQHNGDVYFYAHKALHQFVHISKKVQTLKNAKYVTDVAYDRIGNNLYLTNSNKKKLIVCGLSLQPVRCKTVLYEDITKLTLYPEKGIMFTVSSSMKQIKKVCMNGKHGHVILSSGLSMPGDIVVDKPANRLYWIDEGLGKIESATLDGKDRYTVKEERNNYLFQSLDVFEDNLYLTDKKLDALVRVNKLGKDQPEVVMNIIDIPTTVRVVHPLLQQEDRSVCKNLNCSQICLLSLTTAECSCFDGFLLDKSTSKCTDMNSFDSSLVKGEVAHPVPETKSNGTHPHKDECHLPCRNGGKCLSHGLENKCLCAPGFKGKLCENQTEEAKRSQSSTWIVGVVLAVIGIVVTLLALLYYRYKRQGLPYIRILCNRHRDEEELIADTAVIRGSLFLNGQYHEMDDINYPDDFKMKDCHSSNESLDSAFVSKREDSDSGSANSATSIPGTYEYTQIK